MKFVNKQNDEGGFVIPKLVGLKTAATLFVFLVALTAHAAVLEFRIQQIELKTSALGRMEKTLCLLCVQTFDRSECPVCGER